MKYGKNDIEWQTSTQGFIDFMDYLRKREGSFKTSYQGLFYTFYVHCEWNTLNKIR